MGINIFSLEYWGFSWKQHLLTDKKLIEYSENRLATQKNDLDDISYNEYSKLLDGALSEERERLNSVESKALQIVSQTSIVIAIIGFFAPFALDQLLSNSKLIKAIFIIGLLLVALLFLYAIICSLRNFNLSKFIFVRGSGSTVIDHSHGKISKLNYEIINDKILELRAATHSVNAKASNVIYSFRAFKMAIIILVIYVIGYSCSLFFIQEKNKKIELGKESIDNLKKTFPIRQPVINVYIDTPIYRGILQPPKKNLPQKQSSKK